MRSGEILLKRELVTPAAISEALDRQKTIGGRLGANLIALGYLTEEQLSSVIHGAPTAPNGVAATGIPSAAVLSAIAQAPDGGVLFHCMGGRDRTGIIAMLLLAVAGAEPEAMIDDYLESVRNGAALASAQGRPNSEPACEELCRTHGTTTEGAFRDVVADLDLEPVIGLLSNEERKVITTWRGSLG